MDSADPAPVWPFFIVGTERSGSNLLRLILNSHSSVLVPHPPHIVRYFADLEQYYGNLDEDARFARLVRDVVRLVRMHIHRWDIPITVPEVTAAARWRTVFGVAAAVYDLALRESGKKFWGCKSTFMIDHVDTVLKHYPGARFVHLVRDPRDVAVSSKESVFNPYHPELTAQLWRRQQWVGRNHGERLGARQWLLVRYEDLIREPEEIVSRICDFLGVAFEPGMLQFYESPEARKSARLSASWQNAAKPILRSNTAKYTVQLSAAERLGVERVTRDLMRYYGYEPVEIGPTHRTCAGYAAEAPSFGVRIADHALRVRGEYRSLRHDQNHWTRWRRAMLLWEISGRCRVLSAWDRLKHSGVRSGGWRARTPSTTPETPSR